MIKDINTSVKEQQTQIIQIEKTVQQEEDGIISNSHQLCYVTISEVATIFDELRILQYVQR